MSQQTQIVPIEGRRLVLGFDAGCMTCSGLARRIEEEVGEKIEVLSLRDPKVEQWRKAALGEDAVWAPTLVEVKGLKVRAWTGWQMGVQLGRFLGPAASWRVMQVLGEMGAAPRIERSSVVEKLPGRAAEAVVGMSRGQFLKGVGGAAVAMGVLSGFGPFASSAEALEDWHLPNIVNSYQLKGDQLRDYCNRVAQRVDCEWVANTGYAPAMQSGLSVTGPDDGVAQGAGVKARAWKHITGSGNELYACTFDMQGEKLLSFFWYKEPFRGVKTEIKRWGAASPTGRLWAERMTINGTRFTDPSAPSLQADCDGCFFLGGEARTTTCSSILSFACLGASGGCVACLASTCPVPEPTMGTKIACGACAMAGCPGTIIAACCATTCTVCRACGPF